MLNYAANSAKPPKSTATTDDFRALIDLRDLVGTLWGPGRKRGKAVMYQARWRGDDDTPSFAVYADGFYDFGSGESGSVIDFIMHDQGLDFHGARAWLERYTGGQPFTRTTENSRTEKMTAHEPPPADWQQTAAHLIADAKDYLWSDRPDARRALAYLRDVRGLDDATIRRADLGYNPAWKRTSIRKEDGKNAYLAPGIVIPYHINGAVWALRVRTPIGDLAAYLSQSPATGRTGKSLPKYLNLSGSKVSGTLYNADDITDDRPVVMVEGEFDALLGAQLLGKDYAVCTLGGASNRLVLRWYKRLQSVPRVLLMLDNDAAGQTAADQLMTTLGGDCCRVTLPDGMDVTDAVQADVDLAALIQSADHDAWWDAGVPDGWRTAILTYTSPATAPLVELVNAALKIHLIDADGVTLNELIAANLHLGYGFAASSLRRTFADSVGLFFSKVHTESTQETVCKTEKNTGRPAELFRVLPLETIRRNLIAWATPRIVERHHPHDLDDPDIVPVPIPLLPEMLASVATSSEQADVLVERLNQLFSEEGHKGSEQLNCERAVARDLAELTRSLANGHSSPLPDGWTLGRTQDYRAALLLATNDESSGRSRRQIAALLGISLRSVGTIVSYSGMARVNPDGEYETHTLPTGGDINVAVQRLARKVRGFPRALVAEIDGETIERPYFTDDRAGTARFVADCRAQGGAVMVRLQVANRYQVVREGPPVEADPCDKEGQSDGKNAQKTTNSRQEVVHHGHGSPERETKKPSRRHYGPDYDPDWVHGQIRLQMALNGWMRRDGVFINPQTGEVARDDDTLKQLVSMALGTPIDTGDSVIDLALSLGARLTGSE